MTQVLVKHGEKKELMRLFKVSHVTIRKSLNGNSNSYLAKKIRKTAIDRGGKES